MLQAAPFVGRPVLRLEDPKLLRGEGRYVDDIEGAAAFHAAFVRSAHAHARILSIQTDKACATPGVHAVYTAADLAPLLAHMRLPIAYPEGQLPPESMPVILAEIEAVHVGEPLAMVVASSRYAAEDGAAAVEVDYDPLPAVVDPRAALAPGAPRAVSGTESNVFKRFQVAYGDCAAAFATARHIIREEMRQHRGVAHPLEGRGILARYDRDADTLTVWSSTQMSHELRHTIADLLALPEDGVRVIAPDVGGGFGAKFLVYPEEIAVSAAAWALKGAVKWIEDRREHFVSAIQERDQYWDSELALDADGHILGVRGTLIHDQGAYAPHSINVPYNAANAVPGAYLVPNYAIDTLVVRTNLVSVIPVRGAGWPQGTFVLERLLDEAARRLGLDRAEIRRRNLVPPERMPYHTPMRTRAGGPVIYDSGDYPACQAKGLAAIAYDNFPARQRAARADGRYIGLGMAHGIKGTGRGPFESGVVRVAPTGRVSVYTGALAMGQGLKTALAQVCADNLGVRLEHVDVVCGDTAHVSMGHGGYASRQMITAGSSVQAAARAVRNKAVQFAARLLEVAESDLVVEDGHVHVNGVPGHGIGLDQIARALRGLPGYAFPPNVEAGLEATSNYRIDALAYANAFHACEVEVDIETGGARILRYVAVQDSGRLINPLIAVGQVLGGIAHGIGNSLLEHMRFDSAGQPMTMTLADYLLPSTTDVPKIEVLLHETPSPFNPLGIKGVGEGGVIPAAAALISAIEDALSPFGVRLLEAPVAPARLCALIAAATRTEAR
jgi:carbon-monoxide dehydrogenase large subunit